MTMDSMRRARLRSIDCVMVLFVMRLPLELGDLVVENRRLVELRVAISWISLHADEEGEEERVDRPAGLDRDLIL